MADDAVFQTVERVFNVIPKVLGEFSEERVKAGKKDHLQEVIRLVRARDLDIDLQFVNYR